MNDTVPTSDTPLPQTPSQTVGPFFHDALMQAGVDDVDPDRVAGTPIRIAGTITDGTGEPVGDAMVEVWQADGVGRYRHPVDGRSSDVPTAFVGFGRIATATDGSFHLDTALPGTVPGRNGTIQAPHLNVQIFARGLLDHLCTRVYFAGHGDHDADPVLATVPAERRATLVAVPEGEESAEDATAVEASDVRPTFRFDIVLQGPGETVFFEV